jgi:RimJ/RimL family protein N-acetyltransferase
MTIGLRTERLVGGLPSFADLEDYDRLLNHPDVARTLGGGRTRDQVTDCLVRNVAHFTQHGFGVWTLRNRQGAFVGWGGLKRIGLGGRPEVEILYALLPEYWGRGLATELSTAAVSLGLGELRLPSVIGFTLVDNARSRRVLEKSGLVYERAFEHAGVPHVLYRIRADGGVAHGDASP